jgi:hypothetical protein
MTLLCACAVARIFSIFVCSQSNNQMSQPTSFSVTIVNGDENFEFPFGSTVEDAFTTIHQCYPELKGRFCVISENGENMIDLKGVDSFPHDSEGKQVIFIPARLIGE